MTTTKKIQNAINLLGNNGFDIEMGNDGHKIILTFDFDSSKLAVRKVSRDVLREIDEDIKKLENDLFNKK